MALQHTPYGSTIMAMTAMAVGMQPRTVVVVAFLVNIMKFVMDAMSAQTEAAIASFETEVEVQQEEEPPVCLVVACPPLVQRGSASQRRRARRRRHRLPQVHLYQQVQQARRRRIRRQLARRRAGVHRVPVAPAWYRGPVAPVWHHVPVAPAGVPRLQLDNLVAAPPQGAHGARPWEGDWLRRWYKLTSPTVRDFVARQHGGA